MKCSSLLVALITTMTKKQLWRKGLISFLLLTGGHEEKLRAGTRGRSSSRAREGCCLLACSPWLAQLLSCITQTHLSRNDTSHIRLGPPPFDRTLTLFSPRLATDWYMVNV